MRSGVDWPPPCHRPARWAAPPHLGQGWAKRDWRAPAWSVHRLQHRNLPAPFFHPSFALLLLHCPRQVRVQTLILLACLNFITFNSTFLLRARGLASHSAPCPELRKHERKGGRSNTVTMRRGVTIFILVTVVVLGFAVHSVWTLLGLLVASGREDAILRGELPAPNSGTINERPQLIPKIIHQTYINESIPAHWQGPQQTCLDLHPDYEYKVGRAPLCSGRKDADSR